ncbi:29124_t:CDS:1, partial [Gigaspora margarita]
KKITTWCIIWVIPPKQRSWVHGFLIKITLETLVGEALVDPLFWSNMTILNLSTNSIRFGDLKSRAST